MSYTERIRCPGKKETLYTLTTQSAQLEWQTREHHAGQRASAWQNSHRKNLRDSIPDMYRVNNSKEYLISTYSQPLQTCLDIKNYS
ncbi:hypothetical protein Mapa_004193 [Marchantia paleacea]|nr:hypothetical protein Mapa_004193 [Marchantia paleacea]